MTDTHGLTLSLTYSGIRFQEHITSARECIISANTTSEGIEAAEAAITELIANLGIQVPQGETFPKTNRISLQREEDATYRSCLIEAASLLQARGYDIDSLEPSSLLDEESYKRLRRRFEVGFTLEAHLDKYDIGFLFLAGLIGSLVDWLFVRVPKEGGFLGAESRSSSPMTAFLREQFAMRSENRLSDNFKVPYDAMPSGIRGMNPSMHRLHSVGHDPLVGMAVGIFDILRGGATIIDARGAIRLLNKLDPPVNKPFDAVYLHLGHLLSDAFTPMGLPAPGWSLLNLFSGGPAIHVGQRDRTVSELAQIMYRQGYDLRHFLTMSTATAAVEFALAAYFIFRSRADGVFRESQERQMHEAQGKTYLSTERYTAMSLLAHLIVVSSNGIRIATQGPVALNYPQWLRFLQALRKWVVRRTRNPSEILLAGINQNAKLIMQGWGSLDVESDPMPRAEEYLYPVT